MELDFGISVNGDDRFAVVEAMRGNDADDAAGPNSPGGAMRFKPFGDDMSDACTSPTASSADLCSIASTTAEPVGRGTHEAHVRPTPGLRKPGSYDLNRIAVAAVQRRGSPATVTGGGSTTPRTSVHRRSSAPALSQPLTSPRNSMHQPVVTSRSVTVQREASAPASTPRDSGNCERQAVMPRGDVSVCVRLRPGNNDDDACATAEGNRVWFRGMAGGLPTDGFYPCDCVFGPEAAQEQVYDQAIAPICEAVIRGYNGAVIAYGQTGSGKTHTILGSARARGVAYRAVNSLFAALAKRPNWSVEVSVLEIYNERVRDLLAPGQGVTHCDIHEDKTGSSEEMAFHCPGATRLQAKHPDDALAALAEGMKRRETARTDMNHTSSRSHLIFTLMTAQSDRDMGATLRGRLYLADLAGSERLKRSMSSMQSPRGDVGRQSPIGTPGRGSTGSFGGSAIGGGFGGSRSSVRETPRDQRREACEINKSLSQLALVIQRLTGSQGSSLTYVPYRDSMLTRLLADSFGGNSKTCLIITCSASPQDREETRCSLEFGKRAKLVKNKAEINLEVTQELSPVMRAMVQHELKMMQKEIDELLRRQELLVASRDSVAARLAKTQTLLRDSTEEVFSQHELRSAEVLQLEEEKSALQRCWVEAASQATAAKDEFATELSRLRSEVESARSRLKEETQRWRKLELKSSAERQQLEAQLAEAAADAAERQKFLDERDQQVASLRDEIQSMGREKASAIAQLQEEQTALRSRWFEEVSRLEQEKAAALSRLQERTRAQPSLMEVEVEDPPLEIEDADTRFAELFETRFSERSAQLLQTLHEATSDESKLQQLRTARLAVLEVEKAELRRKWQESFEAAIAQPAATVAPATLASDDDPLSSDERARVAVAAGPEQPLDCLGGSVTIAVAVSGGAAFA